MMVTQLFVEITIPFKTTSMLLTAILTDQFPTGFPRMFAHSGNSTFTSTSKMKNLKSSLIVLSLRHTLQKKKTNPNTTSSLVSVHHRAM